MSDQVPDTEVFRVDVADGKYTVVMDRAKGLYALRYGEPWPACDIAGNNLVFYLVLELDEAREHLAMLLKVCKKMLDFKDSDYVPNAMFAQIETAVKNCEDPEE